jgi:hypothetical protein
MSADQIEPQKPIETSGKIQMASSTIATFMISEKMPIERIIRGRANILVSGFTIELISEKTRPAVA